jgi:hypothetical protein
MLNRFAGLPRVKQVLLASGALGATGAGVLAAQNLMNRDEAAMEQEAQALGLSPEQLLGLAGLAGVTGMLASNENDILRATTAPGMGNQSMGGVAYTDPMSNGQRLEAIARNLQRIDGDVPRNVLVRRRAR